MPWYALYTKPRNERKTAGLLGERGVTVYCPLRETIKEWSDRKKKVQEPLFGSYIFVFLERYETDQLLVLETPGAVRFLWWQGKPAVVREEEITAIRNFLNEHTNALITTHVTEGDIVSVDHGILKEKEAVVVRMKGNKAVLRLSSLGWNITAELPILSLKKQRSPEKGRKTD